MPKVNKPIDTIQRHKELHKMLDELVACYVNSTSRLLSQTSVMDLIKWSHSATRDTSVCKHE